MLTYSFLLNNIGTFEISDEPENTYVCQRIVVHEPSATMLNTYQNEKILTYLQL